MPVNICHDASAPRHRTWPPSLAALAREDTFGVFLVLTIQFLSLPPVSTSPQRLFLLLSGSHSPYNPFNHSSFYLSLPYLTVPEDNLPPLHSGGDWTKPCLGHQTTFPLFNELENFSV